MHPWYVAGRVWISLLAVVLISGCISRPLSDTEICADTQSTSYKTKIWDEVDRHIDLNERSLDLLSTVESIEYLALSGGGANGTFGAGYLIGWNNAGTMPSFHYVTGVSAGALLASQAFTGRVDKLSVFDNLEEHEIIKKKFLPFALFSDSLLSNAPLRKVIAKLNDQETLGLVAAKALEGGVLKVGMVNLDDGRFIKVNLGELAVAYISTQNPAKKKLIHDEYIDSILASTAIPLAMNPVYTNCGMMVDGGVRNQIFLDEALSHFSAVDKTSSREADLGINKRISVTAIVNGLVQLDLSVDGADRAESNLISIGGRSILTIIDSSLDNDLHRICGESPPRSVALTSMDLIASNKLEACREFNEGIFDTRYMSCIYAHGMSLGKRSATYSCKDALSPI